MSLEHNRGLTNTINQSELFSNPQQDLGELEQQHTPAVPAQESEEERAKICRWINDILNVETRQIAFLQLRCSI